MSKFTDATEYNMAVAGPIFKNLMPFGKRFVRHSCTEVYANPKNGHR
jgi:hypothetical protein